LSFLSIGELETIRNSILDAANRECNCSASLIEVRIPPKDCEAYRLVMIKVNLGFFSRSGLKVISLRTSSSIVGPFRCERIFFNKLRDLLGKVDFKVFLKDIKEGGFL
jgi:hypothetical protein